MVSFWEQQSLLHYDVVIVGAGITGLSTAASLKEQNPSLEILVIERGTLPTGASTRNAGFACFGSISELALDRMKLGDSGMVNLVHRRWSGLQKTISRLGQERIGLLVKGGYELLKSDQSSYLDNIDELNDLLKPIFKAPVYQQCDEKITAFGFGQTNHLVKCAQEGQLHTGKLMKSLWQYCLEKKINILTGTEVKSIESASSEVFIHTTTHTFQAKAAGICTNAFTNSLLKKPIDLKPGRGMVMAITPKKPLKASGTFHYEEGYYYFRDFEGKLIFGGGRNLDLLEEETTTFGINSKIEAKLKSDLAEIILPYSDFQIDMIWSGIMAFGPDKSPVLQQVDEGIYMGVRLGGMGVALGSMIGDELADMILSSRF